LSEGTVEESSNEQTLLTEHSAVVGKRDHGGAGSNVGLGSIQFNFIDHLGLVAEFGRTMAAVVGQFAFAHV